MLFNSWEFILFFCIVFAIYYTLTFRFRPLLLLVASYLFYMFWKWEFAVIMLAVTAVNYYTGLKIANSTSKKQQKAFTNSAKMRDDESVEELDVEPKLELGELRHLAKSMSMDA